MAELNVLERRVVKVTDLVADPVTGLTVADFTLTLQVQDGDELAGAAETVAVLEIGSGLYWVQFTPATTEPYYRLEVEMVSAGHVVDPTEFQFDVQGYGAASGPNLTTRLAVRRALDLTDPQTRSHTAAHELDDAIDDLIEQVTALIESETGRSFTQATRTTYLEALGACSRTLVVDDYPIVSVTSLHVSEALPRVWGADQLLVEGTDFIVDAEAGMIHRVDGGSWPLQPKSIRLVTDAGYAAVPPHLERAAIEIIASKLHKGTRNLYHLTSEAVADAAVSGIRSSDIPAHAREVIDSLRAA